MFKCDLKQIVRVRHTIPTVIDFTTHNNTELTYFILGKGSTELNGQEYAYTGNTFAVYNAGTVHNEIDREACDILWMHFDYDIKGLRLKEGVFSDPNKELLNSLLKLRHSATEQQPFGEIMTESILAQSIAIAAKQQETKREVYKGADWQRIIEYIDENINTEINFEKLAEKNHYSYHRFRHIFKERFGVSCHAYLIKRRIEYACHLLENSNAKLTDIAFDCGFTASSQFTNIFKKHTGLTPGEYRKSKGQM